MYIAQLNDENICFSVTQTSGDIELKENLVQLDGYDESYLGKKYENGEWCEGIDLDELNSFKIEETANFILMESLATIQEDLIEQDIRNMEIQAELMEAILKNKGE